MFCQNCGNQMKDTAAFCPKCGWKNDELEGQASIPDNAGYTMPNDQLGSNMSSSTALSKTEFLTLPELKELKEKIDKNLIFSYVFGAIGGLVGLFLMPYGLIAIAVLILTATIIRKGLDYKTTLWIMIASIIGGCSIFLSIELIYLLNNIKLLDQYYEKYRQTGVVEQVHVKKGVGEI